MNILYFLVPLALVLAGLSVFGFWWAARSGQFDDVRTPALRVLIDDEPIDQVPIDQAPVGKDKED